MTIFATLLYIGAALLLMVEKYGPMRRSKVTHA